MHTTLDILKSHRSVRAYRDRPVPEDTLDAILEAAWRAPSSFNAQEISVVVVRDPERRTRISQIAGNQPWIAQAPVFIAVVIDYHKTGLGVVKAGREQQIQGSVDGLLMGAIDAGIVLEALMVAAHAEGLGIVPIGGIRRDPQAMIDLLGLPRLTFPVVGLCMGYPAQEPIQKPRMEISAFRHDEVYDASALPSAIDAYDIEIVEHWRRTDRSNGLAWSEAIANYLGVPDTRPVAEVLRQQGFDVTWDG
ncbi:MAG: NADPH-dependent oxidoreductase [Acidobacteria bacterium]|nr:NADPH-dependent oxidoreductase [Acidobacteriota bacterium]